MPQISLYIDKKTLEKVEKAADSEKMSISGWVRKQLNNTLRSNYPDSFQNLFGSIKDESFTVPERTPFEADSKRESFP